MGKQLLMLINDGVDADEVRQLKSSFEQELATVLISTPQEFPSVETISHGGRGPDIAIDLPFEAVVSTHFDGLVIPDGLLSAKALRKQPAVIELVSRFHWENLPIFASGNAVKLLYDSKILSHHIVVREGTPLAEFVDQAVGVLLDYPNADQVYRATIDS